MFAMVTGTVVFKPGKKKKKKNYTTTWKIENVTPGEYNVIGTIMSQPSFSDKSSIKIIV